MDWLLVRRIHLKFSYFLTFIVKENFYEYLGEEKIVTHLNVF